MFNAELRYEVFQQQLQQLMGIKEGIRNGVC